MDDLASVITAIAAVGWPLVMASLVWKLLPILKSRLSAGDVTVKMFGVEVSLQDASENFGKQLTDLQEKVVQLRTIDEQAHPHSLDVSPTQSGIAPDERILWVDDHPENNAFEIARLQAAEIPVDQVSSTDEALVSLTHKRYTKVITDLERRENGRTAVDLYGDKVSAAGAAGVTSSPLELFEQLHMSSRAETGASVTGPPLKQKRS